MMQKVAELKIRKNAYCTTQIIKALEKNEFKVIAEQDSSLDKYYIIAIEDGSDSE